MANRWSFSGKIELSNEEMESLLRAIRMRSYQHTQFENEAQEHFSKDWVKPVLNIEKWLNESFKLEGQYRSGRSSFSKKGNYGRPTDNYKWFTQCFDVSEAIILKS